MMRRLIQSIVVASALLHADPVTISLDNSTLSGTPGALLSFSGTLTNTTASPVFLNGADFSIANPDLTSDATPFLLNAPASLNASQTTASMELFDIGIPNPFPSGPGNYSGFFDIFGGPTSADQNLVGLVQFTVVVESRVTGVPEPASVYLLLIGAALLCYRFARRGQQRRGEASRS